MTTPNHASPIVGDLLHPVSRFTSPMNNRPGSSTRQFQALARCSYVVRNQEPYSRLRAQTCYVCTLGCIRTLPFIAPTNMNFFLCSLLAFAVAVAHEDHAQAPIQGPHESLWYNTIPGDGGTQADSVFSGISTFGRLQYQPCLVNKDIDYDIAFIGIWL